MTDPLAELEAADAVLLLALCIPNADGTEDADIMADEIAEMVNEERERNGGPQKPAERIGVHLWPTPQFVTAEQIQWLLDVLRDHRAGGTLLARLRAAEAQGDKLAEAVDTFRFAYMGQLGHVVIPDALAEMEDAAREWRALRS